MSKRQSGLFDGIAALGRLAAASAPAPLEFFETSELHHLRRCELHVGTFTSERAELDALRAELQRELAEARALTEKDWPLSYAVEPVAELYWRRPLVERKRKADEAAREEKDRKKREADEVRLAGLRAQKDAEKRASAAAEEEARLKLEREEEQRTWARQKRENDKRIADQSHLTLNEREREVQERLRRNWTEGGALTGPEQEAWPPIYRCEGDCGRPHATQTAAAACEIVRRPTRTPAPAAPRATSSTRPTPTSSGLPALPPPARASSGPAPGLPAIPAPSVSHVTQTGHPVRNAQQAPRQPVPRPAPVPREQHVLGAQEQPVRGGREQLVPGPRTRVSAPSPAPHWQGPPTALATPRRQSPQPRPGAHSGPPASPVQAPPPRPTVTHSPLVANILAAARDGNHLSVNGILKMLVDRGLGAKRQDVYAEVGAMLADGRLVKVNDVIKPGHG